MDRRGLCLHTEPGRRREACFKGTRSAQTGGAVRVSACGGRAGDADARVLGAGRSGRADAGVGSGEDVGGRGRQTADLTPRAA